MEEWKDIPGFEGTYQVSNEGRVRSVDRTITNINGKVFHYKGKIMKLSFHRLGYINATFGKKKYYVHRLVWLAFNGDIPEGMEINHKDECKSNNVLSNLEIMTHVDNVNYGTRTERSTEKHCKIVLQYTLNWEFVCEYSSVAEAVSKNPGFSYGRICDCCNGKRNKHKNYRWAYKK